MAGFCRKNYSPTIDCPTFNTTPNSTGFVENTNDHPITELHFKISYHSRISTIIRPYPLQIRLTILPFLLAKTKSYQNIAWSSTHLL